MHELLTRDVVDLSSILRIAILFGEDFVRELNIEVFAIFDSGANSVLHAEWYYQSHSLDILLCILPSWHGCDAQREAGADSLD